MARRVVALGDVDVVIDTALKRLVQRDGRAHEALGNGAEPLEARLQLNVMVGLRLGNRRHNGNVVALGAHVVRRRHDGNVDIFSQRKSIIKH